MIAWLNENGENVPTAPYTYDAGTEPSWYEYCKDDTGFDDYMMALLIRKGFPIPNPSKPGGPNSDVSNVGSLDVQSFDKAFCTFIESTDQPDKYSTRDWLMLAPKPEYVVSLTLHNKTRSLII
jgi:hypothetical protein